MQHIGCHANRDCPSHAAKSELPRALALLDCPSHAAKSESPRALALLTICKLMNPAQHAPMQ